MGIDYMQGSGMLVTLDQMFSLINKDNYKTVMWSISHAGNWMDEYTEQDLTELQELPFRLEKGFSYKQFMEWFEQFHAVTGEAGKYGGDCRFENGFYSDTMTEIWMYILDGIKVKLPSFECRIFDSGRQAMDCPIGVPCFIFSEEECYNKRLSANGKRLQEFAGELNYVEWTDVSY